MNSPIKNQLSISLDRKLSDVNSKCDMKFCPNNLFPTQDELVKNYRLGSAHHKVIHPPTTSIIKKLNPNNIIQKLKLRSSQKHQPKSILISHRKYSKFTDQNINLKITNKFPQVAIIKMTIKEESTTAQDDPTIHAPYTNGKNNNDIQDKQENIQNNQNIQNNNKSNLQAKNPHQNSTSIVIPKTSINRITSEHPDISEIPEDSQIEKICRFCNEKETPKNKIIAPCKCKGKNKYCHTKCVTNWVLAQNIYYEHTGCEICGENFKFKLTPKLVCNDTRCLEIAIKLILILLGFYFFTLFYLLYITKDLKWIQMFKYHNSYSLFYFVIGVITFLLYILIYFALMKCCKKQYYENKGYKIEVVNFSENDCGGKEIIRDEEKCNIQVKKNNRSKK